MFFKKNNRMKRFISFNNKHMAKRKKIIALIYVFVIVGSFLDEFEENDIEDNVLKSISFVLFNLLYLLFISLLCYRFESHQKLKSLVVISLIFLFFFFKIRSY